MVGENEGVSANAALVAQQQFEKLGFDVRLRRLSTGTMFGKFCGIPRAAVAICPNVGWVKDSAEPQAFLGPTFNGEHIVASGTANWSQLDNAGLNRRMADAALVVDPAERAQAWGRSTRRSRGSPPRSLGCGRIGPTSAPRTWWERSTQPRRCGRSRHLESQLSCYRVAISLQHAPPIVCTSHTTTSRRARCSPRPTSDGSPLQPPSDAPPPPSGPAPPPLSRSASTTPPRRPPSSRRAQGADCRRPTSVIVRYPPLTQERTQADPGSPTQCSRSKTKLTRGPSFGRPARRSLRTGI